MLQSLDEAIFAYVNGLVGRSRWVDRLAQWTVNDYLIPSALALLLVWLWLRGTTVAQRRADTAIVVNALAAQFVANVILKLVNLAYFRPRPFNCVPEVRLLFYRPWDSSCPSNPASFAFAISVCIYLGDKGLGLGAMVLAAIWGFSRVYCGVHYPADVAGGALLGGAVAYWLSRRSSMMTLARERLLSVLRKGLVA